MLSVTQSDLVIEASSWNSLEIAKLVVGILTPIFLFVLGYMVTRAARGVEEAQWASRKLIEQRLDLYERMAPLLNDILVFFLRVGQFQEITPPEAIERKRSVDRIFYAHAPLFTPEFQAGYLAFMKVCFKEFAGGAGKPALIRGSLAAQKLERPGTWKRAWTSMLVTRAEDVRTKEQVQKAYDEMMAAFAADVGVTPAARPAPKRLWFSRTSTQGREAASPRS